MTTLSPGSQPPPAYEQVIVPPVPQAASAYPPAPSNVYAPPKPGNTVLKIVLIVVGVFVLLGVLVAAVIGFGAYKLSKAVNLHKDGGVRISTPGGDITAGDSVSVSIADLGLPDYPGAHRSAGGMRMKTPSGSLMTATFTMADSVEDVVGFYKGKMGEAASVVETGSGTMLTGGGSGHEKKVVTITRDGNHTKIAIVHTTSLQ